MDPSSLGDSDDRVVPAGLEALLFEEESLESVLLTVVRLAAEVAGADEGSAGLVRSGQERTVAASAGAGGLEEIQQASGLGPALLVQRTGRRQHADVALHGGDWPEFAAAAGAAGIRSVLVVPLRVDDRTLGAVSVYSRRERAFGASEVRGMEWLAARAAVALANATTLATARLANLHLVASMEGRELVGVAQGLLMARHHCDRAAAFALLRQASQRGNRKLRDVAAEIVDGHEAVI